MPKILQRTLLRSITNYTVCMFIYYIMYSIAAIIMDNKYNFWGDRDMALFFFIIISQFFGTCIPDYMFIAPFSREERIKMQKKLFLYNHFITWIITSAFIAFPELIMSVTDRNIYTFGKYIFEITVMYFLLFAAGHFRYFNIINKRNLTFTGVSIDILILADSAITAAIVLETPPGNTSFIIMAVAGILAILVSIYCYKTHFKNMIEFYSDYELKTQQKN